MPFRYEDLIRYEIPEVRQRYAARDSMLYALGLGYGADPMDRATLRFCYEKGLRVVPTMAVVLARPSWASNPATGIDYVKVVHGEQGFVLHDEIPPEGEVVGRTRIVDIVDKGPDRGALILTETSVIDAKRDRLLATAASTTFARGDGGCGGPGRAQAAPHPIPERAPDRVVDLPTLPQAALIYRLSGDYNPLHSDPDVATAAGFPRPILHGLCTFGVAGHALLREMAGYEPSRLRAMQGRFSSPVFPGETIRTEMWRDGTIISFRAKVVERDVVVLANGRAESAA